MTKERHAHYQKRFDKLVYEFSREHEFSGPGSTIVMANLFIDSTKGPGSTTKLGLSYEGPRKIKE